MKRIFIILLSALMILSLAACGSNHNGGKTEVTMTAAEVLNNLKKSLGDSYTSDTAESEDRMTGYWGLDLSQIESWAAETNSNSSLNSDCAIVLKVKEGYANDAAALLRKGLIRSLATTECIRWIFSVCCRGVFTSTAIMLPSSSKVSRATGKQVRRIRRSSPLRKLPRWTKRGKPSSARRSIPLPFPPITAIPALT